VHGPLHPQTLASKLVNENTPNFTQKIIPSLSPFKLAFAVLSAQTSANMLLKADSPPKHPSPASESFN